MFLNPGSRARPRDSSVDVLWKNTPVSKSAASNINNEDMGKTAVLDGAAYYSVTFGAASSYNSRFLIYLVNISARAKKIVLTGGTDFLLWPGQEALIFNLSNVWYVSRDRRWYLPASQNIFVDPTNGTDSNAVDGLASGASAFASLAFAYGVVQKYWDLAGVCTVTANLPSGTIAVTAGNTFIGPLVGAQFPGTSGAAFGAPFIINGAGIATTNYTSSTASLDLFQATAGGGIQVQNLSANLTGSASHALTASGQGYIAFQTIDFKAGNTTNGAHLTAAGPHAAIRSMGNWTVSGSINIHAVAEDMAIIYLLNQATISGTPAWTTAFTQADLKGFIEATGFTFSGAGATGKRCQSISQGTIFTNGGSLNTFFPGSVNGTADAASFGYFS